MVTSNYQYPNTMKTDQSGNEQQWVELDICKLVKRITTNVSNKILQIRQTHAIISVKQTMAGNMIWII